jgi:NAD(P)-dependent dehydrogenase (short-subunit alcohol dehydrogenase family)
MYDEMRGKNALITGAGKKTGMGYAIAKKMASCGTNIALADLGALTEGPDKNSRDEAVASMDEIAKELRSTFDIETCVLSVDVSSTESVAVMAADYAKKFPHINIICNNAGAAFGVPSTFNTYDEAKWLKTIDVNLHGPFRVTRALLPMMLGRKGSIVNTASRAGKFPPIFNGAYAVAKSGLIMLTKVMAKELGGAGIRVNAICPGQIMTDLLRWQLDLEARAYGITVPDREKDMCKSIPLGTIGTTDDIADLVVFLASDESKYITGQAINICGGQLMEL